MQWSNQIVTNKPPPIGDPEPEPSILSKNFTAVGFPELSYYYE